MARIYVAGHNGMVGASICRQLEADKANVIVTVNRNDLDLTNQTDVREFIADQQIDQVYLAAARVGGIYANNSQPAQFIYDNLMIQTNVIDASYKAGVKKLLFLGSSCIYPRDAQQPMEEGLLLTGKLEPTNEPYAIAKIAGIKMCESYNRQYGVDYRSIMPTNLYGPGDNYHFENSHVIPGLIARFHDAKVRKLECVNAWGSGKSLREFLHVDDMALASIFVNNLPKATVKKFTKEQCSHINVGSGQEVSIKELTELVCATVNYCGKVSWDASKPDGAPRKLMSSDKLRGLGWKPTITLKDGLASAYLEYQAQLEENMVRSF